MDPNSASAGPPKSGKDKEKKSKKNYEGEGDGKKKFVSVLFLSWEFTVSSAMKHQGVFDYMYARIWLFIKLKGEFVLSLHVAI